MRTALAPVIDKCVVLYLDDILIYSDTEEEHIEDIRKVLTLLREHRLYAKLSKCSFMQEETEFLGHIISKDGIKTNGGLVKAIREWPQPRTLRELLQFLGLANFYRQYVKGYADIALPLTELLNRTTPFTWSRKAQAAFNKLKAAITSAPVLRIFDPALSTAIGTDASGFAIGAVLFQTDQFGRSRPVAFTSRKLNPAERNYPVHEQELLAVVHALRTWRYYLDGSHFIVYTDHATLQHFPTQPNLTRRQARWMELLQEYNFDFRYKRGVDNIVPDALSRRPDHQDKPPDQTSLASLQVDIDPSLHINYARDTPMTQNGLLFTNIAGRTRLCIPDNDKIRNQLLHDAHDSKLAGHLGFDKTYDLLCRRFYWPRLAKDTKAYVLSCDLCQRNKPSLQQPAGLYMPLAIPGQRWDTVSMDFIVKLPKTARGYDAITVFVDKLSKQVHFCPSNTTDTAADVARIFFREVFRLHGMPRAIVSDRDSRFTGHFWTTLMGLMDTKLDMSTAFHPQSDGQTERANYTLEEMLRAYISYNQKDWDVLLPMMEFAYNNSQNPSTGFSPFRLNYGHDPVTPSALLHPIQSNTPAATEFILQQQSALTQAQDAIHQAQERQKTQADKARRPSTFKVGDMVLLNADHLSLAARQNRPARKLEPKYIGPFRITRKANDNAFELALPSTMKQYPVFNTDLLRPYISSPPSFNRTTTDRPLPITTDDGDEEYEVERILDYKMDRKTPKWLVLWKGYTLDDAT
ncbi:hypothetical protein EMPS_00257 [Entomortierella parvispora]|uniref:Uncharacterized protein n=1 Tax=Entomortierella parvispora TaxID=205924 RepID=A0A9P3H092_9FUNG|nr:hypothetical protein EMPS_00257 [Entomortierella parvispora]